MTDRELLELAARATGWNTRKSAAGNLWVADDHGGYPWNPLEIDGQALRLAVRLGLKIWHAKWPSGAEYSAAQRVWNTADSVYEDDGVTHGEDPYAATRRAIVRAAAEIGRAKP